MIAVVVAVVFGFAWGWGCGRWHPAPPAPLLVPMRDPLLRCVRDGKLERWVGEDDQTVIDNLTSVATYRGEE